MRNRIKLKVNVCLNSARTQKTIKTNYFNYFLLLISQNIQNIAKNIKCQ